MQEFLIAPAARSVWASVLIPAVILFLISWLLGAAAYAARAARFEVSASGLRLRGDVYGRLIPAEQLRAAEARVVDLANDPGLRPVRRTWGTGLPGYRSGWYRLQSGEQALLYLTNPGRAVYVPTTAGYAVLLSPRDPDAFVAAIRALAARAVPTHAGE